MSPGGRDSTASESVVDDLTGGIREHIEGIGPGLLPNHHSKLSSFPDSLLLGLASSGTDSETVSALAPKLLPFRSNGTKECENQGICILHTKRWQLQPAADSAYKGGIDLNRKDLFS